VRAFVRPECLIARGDPLCRHTEKKLKQQVGVQLLTPAGNVTLLAFAVERRVVVRRAAVARMDAAIDRYLLPAGPTAANPPHAASAVDRWHRQTDGHRTIT